MLRGEDINEFLREQARLYKENPDDDFNEALLEQQNDTKQQNEDTTEVPVFTLD